MPIGLPEFVENPEPRCPVILLCDTSGSMSGEPINALNLVCGTIFLYSPSFSIPNIPQISHFPYFLLTCLFKFVSNL